MIDERRRYKIEAWRAQQPRRASVEWCLCLPHIRRISRINFISILRKSEIISITGYSLSPVKPFAFERFRYLSTWTGCRSRGCSERLEIARRHRREKKRTAKSGRLRTRERPDACVFSEKLVIDIQQQRRRQTASITSYSFIDSAGDTNHYGERPISVGNGNFDWYVQIVNCVPGRSERFWTFK